MKGCIALFVCAQNYEVLKQIGKGGFATVHRGRCRRTGRSVAIKMVRLFVCRARLRLNACRRTCPKIDKKKLMQRMKLSDMTSRVTTEIEIHSRLDHPSIVKVRNEDLHFMRRQDMQLENNYIYLH